MTLLYGRATRLLVGSRGNPAKIGIPRTNSLKMLTVAPQCSPEISNLPNGRSPMKQMILVAAVVAAAGSAHAQSNYITSFIDSSLEYGRVTGKLGVAIGSPTQIGGYQVGLGLAVDGNGNLTPVYGRTANTALQGNDAIVGLATTATQPADLAFGLTTITAASLGVPTSAYLASTLLGYAALDGAGKLPLGTLDPAGASAGYVPTYNGTTVSWAAPPGLPSGATLTSAILGTDGETLTLHFGQPVTLTAADIFFLVGGSNVSATNADQATLRNSHVFTLASPAQLGQSVALAISTTAFTSPALAAPIPFFNVTNNSNVSSAGSPPVTTVSASGASQTLAYPASGNVAFDVTLTANCTIALSGGTAGQYQSITLILRQGGSGGFTPTLPSGVKWRGGTAPTPNTVAGNIDVFTFSTPDARTTVIGSY